MDAADAQTQMSLLLFGLSLVITLVTFLGSLYSLLSLLRMRNKTSLSLIVASMSIDDLISVVPLSLFMTVQWEVDSAHKSGARCTLAGLLYIFQGISSNLKASLMVVYTFYITKRFGVFQSAKRPLRIVWAILAVWVASLVVSILPVCGWGSFSPTDMGCFADSTSSYTVLLFVLYSVCFCVLVAFSVPLTHQLLCSDGHQRSIHPSYLEIARQHVGQGAAPVCDIPSLSGQDSLDKTFRSYIERTENSLHLNNKVETHTCSSPPAQYQKDAIQSDRDSPVFFAQKRFSLILAMIRNMLWMPMMIQIFVSHVLHFKSSSFETLGFILTLLSAAVTPVFVLSERWLHLPCGCFINCRREAYSLSYPTMAKKRGFEFNLSPQPGFGLRPTRVQHHALGGQLPPHSAAQTQRPRPGGAGRLRYVSKRLKKPLYAMKTTSTSAITTTTTTTTSSSSSSSSSSNSTSNSSSSRISILYGSNFVSFFLQRSGGGLAIPLCAFQGTVSLHAPTGKTLSLSTYEVSSDGFKISPTSKKIEVYRSKSVGHEPSAEESPNSIADTNVKIHLEVLEICDNEEAMDTVSIVSNISQSSAHARSPSLRYSRRENRFVSCDLGETASYSLFIPTNNPDSDINITIPDTVEAHRQNSKKQHQDKSGYREEIQLLNEAYRKQEENPQN
ncbi:GP149 protein, partial [Amia calva]|nr:GP149 protein [Amia calva]